MLEVPFLSDLFISIWHFDVIVCSCFQGRLCSPSVSLRLRPHVYVFKSTPFSKVSVFARPHDNAAFPKVSVFESLRFRKSPFSVKKGLQGHIHTYTFSCENGDFSVRFRLPSTRKRLFGVFESLRFHRKRRLSKTGLKVETFENGDFRKRCVVVWTGENGEF